MTKCVAAIQVLEQKCKECKREYLPRLVLPGSSRPGLNAGALPEPITPTSTLVEEVDK